MFDRDTTTAATLSYITGRPFALVTFEETGEQRQAVRDCAVCCKAGEAYGCEVVSPSGVVHIGCDGGDTLCGKDATRDAWWWPL